MRGNRIAEKEAVKQMFRVIAGVGAIAGLVTGVITGDAGKGVIAAMAMAIAAIFGGYQGLSIQRCVDKDDPYGSHIDDFRSAIFLGVGVMVVVVGFIIYLLI